MISRKIMENVAFSKFNKMFEMEGTRRAKVVYIHPVLSLSPFGTLLSNFAFTYLHLIFDTQPGTQTGLDDC